MYNNKKPLVTNTPMDLRKTLLDYGLSSKEVDVYLALLPRGQAPASTIGKITGQPRSTARFNLEQLVSKGLISETVQHNTSIYLVEPPEKLKYLLDRQKDELKAKEDLLDSVLTELKNMHNPSSILPKVRFGEGMDEVTGMFADVVGSAPVLKSFGAADYIEAMYPDKLKKIQSKVQKGYKEMQMIRAGKYRAKHDKDAAHIKTRYFKFLEELKVDISVIGNKIAISSLADGQVAGVLIEHQAISEAFEAIFDEMWQLLNEKK